MSSLTKDEHEVYMREWIYGMKSVYLGSLLPSFVGTWQEKVEEG